MAWQFDKADIRRCVQLHDDSAMLEWLEVADLRNDTILSLHGLDNYAAHTAIRHITEVNLQRHKLYVAMPPELRQNRAFTR